MTTSIASAALIALLAFAATAEAKQTKPAETRTLVKRNVAEATPDWCYTEPWPIGRDLSVEEVSREISTLDRMYVLRLAWGEAELGDPKHMVAPLFRFLGGTEQNETLRGYYKSMGFLAQNGVSVEDGIKAWPKRLPLASPRMSVTEMCQHFARSGGMKRDPSASPKAAAKSAKKASAKKKK